MSELAWSAAELADEFHCCVEIIERLTTEGRIPHVRLSPRKTIYPKQQIADWLATEARAATVLAELKNTSA